LSANGKDKAGKEKEKEKKKRFLGF